MDLSTLLSGSNLLSSGALAAVTSTTTSSGLSGMFSGPTLIASLIISTIGFSYFSYGKKNGYNVALGCGVLLMVFPYFIYNVTSMAIIAGVLCVIPFVIRN